ncbi:GNAT family N-acetyltransferase [Falsiroseomonas sp.]|uniref:GNAT family N-acetyltransferase n=1 Tax=Falsiroseomonas sp. TaxID=2870721 RepID=UPI003F71813E
MNALSAADFAALAAVALSARMIEGADGAPAAFLLALSHETPAQGPNHGWFLQHFPAFAYIDRVVVAQQAQGQGLGRALYADLREQARAAGLAILACEVNLDPPNPGSMAFHERLGFRPAGEATDPRNGKRVRYLTAGL